MCGIEFESLVADAGREHINDRGNLMVKTIGTECGSPGSASRWYQFGKLTFLTWFFSGSYG